MPELPWQMVDKGNEKLREVGLLEQTVLQEKPREYLVSQSTKEGAGGSGSNCTQGFNGV